MEAAVTAIGHHATATRGTLGSGLTQTDLSHK